MGVSQSKIKQQNPKLLKASSEPIFCKWQQADSKWIGCNKIQQNDIPVLLKKSSTKPVYLNNQQHVLKKSENQDGQDDQRRLCQNPHAFPYSAIGVLFVSLGGLKAYGTAFFIDKNVALTAAHNLYYRKQKIYANRAVLMMQLNGQSFKTYRALCAYIPKQFTSDEHQYKPEQYDYAVLIFQNTQDLGATYGILPLSTQMAQNDQIEVFGYPDDLSNKQFLQEYIERLKDNNAKYPQQHSLFGCKNILDKLTQKQIHHKVDTNVGQSGSPILKRMVNQQWEAIGVHTNGLITINKGVRITKQIISRIAIWKQAQINNQRVNFPDNTDRSSMRNSFANYGQISITPDTQTYAWLKKQYELANTNKKICIRTSYGYSDWLCSSDLPQYGEFVFAVRPCKVTKANWQGIQGSCIIIGVMESEWKGKEFGDTWKHCVHLHPTFQGISRPNQDLSAWQEVPCFCQSSLPQLPCLVQCHVNRQQNTIAWHYNGKTQAKSSMPISWKNERKTICAIIWIWIEGDCVEFM